MTWIRNHRWALLAMFAGLLLRLYFICFHAHIVGDTLVYGDLAANLLKHHIFGLTEGTVVRPTLIRMPGYPLFLAACFQMFGVGKYAAVLYLQLALDLATCWLVGALARRLAGSRAGLWAIWLAALCPFTANYVAAPLTETPAIFCASAALYALQRWRAAGGRWILPLSTALTCAVLLRPDRALLAVSIVSAMLWIAWRGPSEERYWRVVSIALACAVVALPLAVWGARNWQVFHVLQPLSPKYANDPGEFVSYGFQRWYRTWAIEFESTVKVYWEYDGDLLDAKDLPGRAFESPAQRIKTYRVIARYNDSSAATKAVDHQFAVIAADRIRANPLRYYLGLPVARTLNMWLRPRTEMLPAPLDWWRFRAHPRLSAWTAVYAALNLAYLSLAVLGVACWRRRGPEPIGGAAITFVLMRSALLLTLDNSEPRYTIDCYPVILLFAAIALAHRRAGADA